MPITIPVRPSIASNLGRNTSQVLDDDWIKPIIITEQYYDYVGGDLRLLL
jgi:hypothetical protein